MEGLNDGQDLYSSTSSDDHSSVSSVVHVEPTLDTSESARMGASTRRENQNNGEEREARHRLDLESGELEHNGQLVHLDTDQLVESQQLEMLDSEILEPDHLEGYDHESDAPEGRRPRQVDFSVREPDLYEHETHVGRYSEDTHGYLQDDDSSSEEDEDERRRREEDVHSDTSTSSEDTTIRRKERSGRWVQQTKPRTPTSQGRPKAGQRPGPGPPKYPQSPGSGPVTMVTPAKRQSIISQASSGRMETRLLGVDDIATAGDSGLSTESPETHSNQGDLTHSTHSDYTPQASSSRHHGDRHRRDRSDTSSQPPRSYLSYLGDPPGAMSDASRGMYSPSPSSQRPLSSPGITAAPSPLPPTMLLRDGQPSSQCVMVSMDDAGHLLRESMTSLLSLLYALLLVTVGTILPLAEIFSEDIPHGTFEGFYIYLFGGSVLFLVYVYLFLLRSSSSHCCRRRRPVIHDHEMQREDSRLNQSAAAAMWRQKAVYVSRPHNNTHTGSFYLRLGAVGFGIGSMIHEGLMFGQLFDRQLVWECISITTVVRPVSQLVFTFIQLYFIFLNSKMLIHKYQTLARFGLMHMIATNLCVWVRVVITETMRQIAQPDADQSWTNSSVVLPLSAGLPGATYDHGGLAVFDEVQILPHGGEGLPLGLRNTSQVPEVSTLSNPTVCFRHNFMGRVVEAASPYLYPCTIQYSVITAVILVLVWRCIGAAPAVTPSSVSDSEGRRGSRLDCDGRRGSRVDCSGASRGLFCGVLALVAVVIAVVVAAVLEEARRAAARLLALSVAVGIAGAGLAAVGVAAVRLRRLRWLAGRDVTLDAALQTLGLGGVYTLAVYNLVAGGLGADPAGCPLLMAAAALTLLQTTAQTALILAALRRSAATHSRARPGRDALTFLLVCNLATLGVDTARRTPPPPLYTHLAWTVTDTLATPLAALYRFHSIVCLATVWHQAYRVRLN